MRARLIEWMQREGDPWIIGMSIFMFVVVVGGALAGAIALLVYWGVWMLVVYAVIGLLVRWLVAVWRESQQ